MKRTEIVNVGDIVMPINTHKDSTNNKIECVVVEIKGATGKEQLTKDCHHIRVLLKPLNPDEELKREYTDAKAKGLWYSKSNVYFIRHGKVKVKRVK